MKIVITSAAAIVFASLAFLALDTTPAAARDYAFCLTGRDFAGFGDCQFDTYEQCQATASGRDAQCNANPYPGYYDRIRSEAAPRKRRGAR